jgi:hypothetical protein
MLIGFSVIHGIITERISAIFILNGILADFDAKHDVRNWKLVCVAESNHLSI